ncbi:reverse transcriptase family protein [Uliginosibacterium sp. H3]|uniref:RNA-directed DNA polymerase n=1 Tax=Uliginosibacterium silvisoli TaxID=3114758 RepID=A0ABU6K5T7_9RHOO|nr:reverse transcriptase family protein [Uliginosibacterium sp. H3]
MTYYGNEDEDEDDDDLWEPHITPHMCDVARALVRAFLHGESTAAGLRERGATALGRKWPWLKALVRALLEAFGAPLHAGQHDKLVQWALDFSDFQAAFYPGQPAPQVRVWFIFHPVMASPPTALMHALVSFGAKELPRLHTLGDLAAWLQLTPSELDWFADTAGWGSKVSAPKLLHYDSFWRAKARGGWRLIEAPRSRLLAIQRRILHDLLDHIPVHAAAHGCVPGRSVISNAALHVGAQTLVRLDLRDFFTSIRASRVHALFRSLGYTREVSRYLTGLTTHCTSPAVLRGMSVDEYASVESVRKARLEARKYLQRHLPQGAPTSPALANLCAYRLDLRLAGAAEECGARYSRYVDDLVVSCPTPSRAHAARIALMAQTIILEEGFVPNPRKTQIASRAQAQRVTGLVVNDRLNVPRKEFDLLKATLTNCLRHGPATQNRESHADFRAHLLGRVAHVVQVNPLRGQRLRALFERIEWNSSPAADAGI